MFFSHLFCVCIPILFFCYSYAFPILHFKGALEFLYSLAHRCHICKLLEDDHFGD
jgi:hypothetical protein